MLTQAAKICISVTTVLGVIAIAAVALRFWCRLRIQKISAGADDWCILSGMLVSTGIAILTNYVAATTGVGDPNFSPTLDQVIFALQCNLGLECAQVLCMGLLKISLLLYYKRILVLQVFKTIVNVLIGVVAAFEIAIVLACILSKGPDVTLQWDPMVPYTINISAMLISFCAGNAALDAITLMLPIAAVSSLHMKTSKKLLVSVIFTLGSFCVIASIVRLSYAIKFTKVPATGGSFFQAPFTQNILWALIEPPVFILAGCLLTLGPLFRSKYGPKSIFRSLRSRLRSVRSTGGGNSGSGLSGSGVSNEKGARVQVRKVSGGSESNLWRSEISTVDDAEVPDWEGRAGEVAREQRMRGVGGAGMV